MIFHSIYRTVGDGNVFNTRVVMTNSLFLVLLFATCEKGLVASRGP